MKKDPMRKCRYLFESNGKEYLVERSDWAPRRWDAYVQTADEGWERVAENQPTRTRAMYECNVHSGFLRAALGDS